MGKEDIRHMPGFGDPCHNNFSFVLKKSRNHLKLFNHPHTKLK